MRPITLLSVCVLILRSAQVVAQTIDLGQVGASGSGGSSTDATAAKPGTAAAVAPTQSSLGATEPQTILNQHFIQDMASPASDYLSLVEFSPSAANATPNGLGLSSKNGTMRGFQDGQYNVTVDGIPFGDPSQFGHAPSSFFPAPVIDHVVVDRGPGTASTVGNATFGGTMALFTGTPSQNLGGQVDAAAGSGNAYEAGGIFNSGTIAATRDTTVLFNFDHLNSDGLLDYAGFDRQNGLLKVMQPLGSNTVLTLVSNYSDLKWNTYTQPSVTETKEFGLSFAGLNNNPNSQGYQNYNLDYRRADFEYLGLQSDWDFIRVDNKIYTYSLNDQGSGGADLTGATPNAALLPGGGVPGGKTASIYRSWGDIIKLEKDIGSGLLASTLRAGAWVEHARYTQFEQTVNLVTGEVETLAPYLKEGSILNNNLAVSDSNQEYLEAEWRPLPGLSVTPGFKHVDFKRTFDGVLSFAPYDTRGDYNSNLGSVSVNYRVRPDLSVYGQWAMGFQAPPVTVLETQAANFNQVSPQQTVNWQAGIVYQTERIAADMDVYYINFHNKINSELETIDGFSNQTVYFNAGGVIYKGVEAEATYMLGAGFALTANGSLNSAYIKSNGLQISNAPSSTAAVGVLYDDQRVFGSLLTKVVGHMYDGAGQLAGNSQATYLSAYSFTELALGMHFAQRVKLQFLCDDLFDQHGRTDGNGSATNPTFYYLPGRNFIGKITVDL